MTDADLVAKRLAFVETCVYELKTLVRPDEIQSDLRARRFAEHTLQLAIQAALDVASHVVSDGRLGEPATNRELFEILARNGWLRPETLPALLAMASFRNRLVHAYTDVDSAVVRRIVEHHLGDLLGFVEAVRGRLNGPTAG